jgi:hypothetical protein
MREEGAAIRLPPGSGVVATRPAYMKLLCRVNPESQNGFGFEGSLLRPGAWVTKAALRPTLEYPEIPVLLEYSMAISHREGARRRSEGLYVLWRWENQKWHELGRSLSAAWEWAVDLRPLAIRALAEARGDKTIETAPDLAAIAGEISTYLDERVNILKPPDRARLLGILHDQFATRATS